MSCIIYAIQLRKSTSKGLMFSVHTVFAQSLSSEQDDFAGSASCPRSPFHHIWSISCHTFWHVSQMNYGPELQMHFAACAQGGSLYVEICTFTSEYILGSVREITWLSLQARALISLTVILVLLIEV